MLQSTYRCIGIVAVIALLASCIRANSAEEKLNAKRDLIVFVGKKLSVIEQPAKENSLDGKFQAAFASSVNPVDSLHRVLVGLSTWGHSQDLTVQAELSNQRRIEIYLEGSYSFSPRYSGAR